VEIWPCPERPESCPLAEITKKRSPLNFRSTLLSTTPATSTHIDDFTFLSSTTLRSLLDATYF
jgi:hypothetical protein